MPSGGRRDGAGRKPGFKGKGRLPGAIAKIKRDLQSMAREYAEAALKTLVSIAGSSANPPAARVSAAVAVLDRGYGRPPQMVTANADEMRKAINVSDDELASIAAGSGNGTAPPAIDTTQLN